MLYNHKGKIILKFSQRVLTGAPLTEAQAEALDAVHFCALKHSLELSLRSGDICFIKNLTVMHSRSAFVDYGPNILFLLRSWLSDWLGT